MATETVPTLLAPGVAEVQPLELRRRWRAKPYRFADAQGLVAELGVSSTLAAVLVRRGYRTPATAREFLAAESIHDPFLIEGLRDAATSILEHVEQGTKITVHGDYDADGVCATALTVRALRRHGATVDWFLPSRFDEGYGIARSTIDELAAKGTGLMIAVDCGITAQDEVEYARERGLEIVITDHHRPDETLPDCLVVHPGIGEYPCPYLCGTGVAFKLAQGMAELAGRPRSELDEDLDLVALATVADVVELIGENRTLVRRGLQRMSATTKPGLKALMEVARVEPGELTTQSIGFRLAPRINAAGRLYRADAGVELLLTDDPTRATEIAAELDAINRERRDEGLRTLIEAETALRDLPQKQREAPALVLAGEGWHPGVIGIVAGRLADRLHRPTVVIALGEEGGKGSGRSVPAYDLHAGLKSCEPLLRRFGGHRQAAGLEIDPGNIEQLRLALIEHASQAIDPADMVAIEEIDAVVPGDSMTLEVAEELESIEPCGQGNPPVTLLVPWARIDDVRPMGDDKHVRFKLTSGGVTSQGVGFGTGPRLKLGGSEFHDVSFRLESNRWKGSVEPRLVLSEVYPSAVTSTDAAKQLGCSGCDCRLRGERWWQRVRAQLDIPLDELDAASNAPEPGGDESDSPRRTVVDWRGRGSLGVLGNLLSTGESVAVVCADVSRRRALLSEQLDPTRFGMPAAQFACSRGDAEALAGAQAAMLDYETAADSGELLSTFEHLALVDPPAFEAHAAAVLRGPAKHCVHLLTGAAEREFAAQVHAQKWELRGACTAIFKALRDRPSAGSTALDLCSLLSGDGPHPRPPEVVGRALRVLRELGLIELDLATTPAIDAVTLVGGDGAVELEHSSAYRAYSTIYGSGIRSIEVACAYPFQ